MALGGSLWFAVAGAFTAACGQSSALVLLVSAAQEDVPDTLLGRVLELSRSSIAARTQPA
jgi:hypothetical protein